MDFNYEKIILYTVLPFEIIYILENCLDYEGQVDRIIKCYHTCSLKGGKDKVIQRVPFLSESRGQWLGQGFYFWTDSLKFAELWGIEHYSSNYAINEFEVTVPEKNFFDLVGNVSQQEEFLAYVDSFYLLLDEMIEKKTSPEAKKKMRQELSTLRSKGVTVSSIFWVLKKLKKIDHYWVVKAYDQPRERKSINYLASKEFIVLPTRQQIVVYQHAKKVIEHKNWIYP